MTRHGQNFGVVGAALDDHVDLDGCQAHALRFFNALEHIGHRKVHVIHAPEHCVIEPVQADSDALQAGVFQTLGFFGQQRCVGCQRDVQGLTAGCLDFGQHPDQHFKVLAQQRLATGQADFFNAVGDKNLGQAGDFFKAQQRALRQKCVVLVKHLARHAVAAAEVAAVGHADAQVTQRPGQCVGQQARGREQFSRNQGHTAGVADVSEGNDFVCHACLNGLNLPHPVTAPGLKRSGRRRLRCRHR